MWVRHTFLDQFWSVADDIISSIIINNLQLIVIALWMPDKSIARLAILRDKVRKVAEDNFFSIWILNPIPIFILHKAL